MENLMNLQPTPHMMSLLICNYTTFLQCRSKLRDPIKTGRAVSNVYAGP